MIDIVEGVSLGSIGNRARCLNHIEAETPQPFNCDAIRVLMLGFTKGKDVQVVGIEQVANIIGLLIHRANIQHTEPKFTVNSDQVTLTPWTSNIILQLQRRMVFRFNAGRRSDSNQHRRYTRRVYIHNSCFRCARTYT